MGLQNVIKMLKDSKKLRKDDMEHMLQEVLKPYSEIIDIFLFGIQMLKKKYKKVPITKVINKEEITDISVLSKKTIILYEITSNIDDITLYLFVTPFRNLIGLTDLGRSVRGYNNFFYDIINNIINNKEYYQQMIEEKKEQFDSEIHKTLIPQIINILSKIQVLTNGITHEFVSITTLEQVKMTDSLLLANYLYMMDNLKELNMINFFTRSSDN